LLNLIATIRISDFIDIALLAIVIYRFLLLIKGTRTIPMMIGLTVLLGGTYVLARLFSLDATGWLVENTVGSAVVILVVLFQTDIRNALAQVGLTTMFRESSPVSRKDLIDEVVQTAFSLSRRKVGALIVLERESGLRNYIEQGKLVMAVPSAELMESLFHTSSPLHDGAVIINRDGRLAAAGCILPLTSTKLPNTKMGTRHRAAMGISEETDALVVVVSEERGQVSLVHKGSMQVNMDKSALHESLTTIFQEYDRTNGLASKTRQTFSA